MSCEDIPSLLDLQKVKKHAEDFGRLMGTGTGTSTNEVTGQVRPTFNKVMSDMNSEFDQHISGMAFTRVGTFKSGATLDDLREVLLWDVSNGGDGHEYGWTGTFPKDVLQNSTPSSTGGIGNGAWVDRSDVTLRSELAAPGGAGLVGGLAKPVTWNGFAGGADPSGATPSDAAFSTASSTGNTIFVPPGDYLINSNLDISLSEWEFSRGAKLNISTGVTVTIGNVSAGLFQIFTGSGNVVFSAENDVAYPEWFGSVLSDGIVGLEKCTSACTPNRVRMHISNNLRLSRKWSINSRIPITCNPRASFDATGGATHGVEILEGAVNWNCKVQLPNIAGFTTEGVKLRGCSLINLEIGAIANCGIPLHFETLSGIAPNSLDNNVRIQSIQGCTSGIVASGDNSANIFQGNEVYVNFMVGCPVAVEYRSVGGVSLPNFDSNSWDFSAIDGAIPGSVGLKNSTPSAISKVNFNVRTWAGGFGATGKFVSGKFNGSIIKLRINGEPPYSAMDISGSGNTISYERKGWASMPIAECTFSGATALSDFNGGVPVNNNQIRLRLTVPSVIPSGSSVVGFACTPLDDGESLLFSVTPTLPKGMTLNYVRREAKNVVKIVWTNYGVSPVAAGERIDFTLNIG